MKYETAAEFHEKFRISESLFHKFIGAAEEKGIKGSKSEIETSKDWIDMRLKALIARQQWNDEGFFRAIHENDPMIEKAMELLYAKQP